MNTNEDEDYAKWLNQRRTLPRDDGLADRIMAAVENRSVTSPVPAQSGRSSPMRQRIGPMLLWTAASLVFVIRITSLIGNLVFPTESYPEFAADHRKEEHVHEQRVESRS